MFEEGLSEYAATGELAGETEKLHEARHTAPEGITDKERTAHDLSERIRGLESRAADGDEGALRKVRTLQDLLDTLREN